MQQSKRVAMMKGVSLLCLEIAAVAGLATVNWCALTDNALAADAKKKYEICFQVRTRAECEKEPACRVEKRKDGQYYCVPNSRDYPPYKGGYPLLAAERQ
jgi:hypothetical protein